MGLWKNWRWKFLSKSRNVHKTQTNNNSDAELEVKENPKIKNYHAKTRKFNASEYVAICIAVLTSLYSAFIVLQQYQLLKSTVTVTTNLQNETSSVQEELDLVTQELKQKNTDFDNTSYKETVAAILGEPSCVLEKIDVYQKSTDNNKSVLITTLTDIEGLDTLTQASSLVVRFKVGDITTYLEYVDTRGISFKTIDIIPLTNTVIVEYQFWGGKSYE